MTDAVAASHPKPRGFMDRTAALCYKKLYIYHQAYNEGLLKFCLLINFLGLLPGISSIYIYFFLYYLINLFKHSLTLILFHLLYFLNHIVCAMTNSQKILRYMMEIKYNRSLSENHHQTGSMTQIWFL